MRRTGIFVALLTCLGLLVVKAATVDVVSGGDNGNGQREVVLRDDCDPTDLGWVPLGGCSLPEGDVNLAEFNSFLLSPLAPSVIGHPSWWFDPTYLKAKAGKSLKISNEGGRVHTFTEVANFGGGRVPPLNLSQPGIPPLAQAPECVAPGVVDIPGGGKDVVDGLAPGNHRFQCCIHPWMRTLVKVEADDED